MSEPLRLQKYIASQGLCSRRKAEELIEAGSVKVNGIPAHLGQKVDPVRDRIWVSGRTIKPRPQKRIVLMMNKPKGYVCTNSDPHHERTVFDLLPQDPYLERLFCAGRLDKDSDGMIILTNDGKLANRLTHPSQQITKRYRVTLTRPFQLAHKKVMLDGMVLEGERLSADKIILAKRGMEADRTLEIHLSHGRKREIRRMVESLGYFVKRLHRFQIGQLVLRGVGPGNARSLSTAEIDLLFKQ